MALHMSPAPSRCRALARWLGLVLLAVGRPAAEAAEGCGREGLVGGVLLQKGRKLGASTDLLEHSALKFEAPASSGDEEEHVQAMRARYAWYFAGAEDDSSDSADLQRDLAAHRELVVDETAANKTLAEIANLSGRALTLAEDGDLIAKLLRTDLPDLMLTYRLLPEAKQAQLLPRILDACRQLALAGINGSHFVPAVSERAFTLRGNLAFEPVADSVFLRLRGGFGRALVLLRSELDKAMLLNPRIDEPAGGLLAALRQKTRLWEANSAYLGSSLFTTPGLGSDTTRVIVTDRLAYCLCLGEAGDSSGTRSEHLLALKRWLEKGLAMVTSAQGTFKPDGDLQAHGMHYGNAYPYVMLPMIAEAAYVLHGSPWALSSGALQRTAHALHVLGLYTANGASPRAVGGRLVRNDKSAVGEGQWCASVVFASLDGSVIDAALRDRNAAIAHLARSAYERGGYGGLRELSRSRPGCIRLWHGLKPYADRAAATAKLQGWFEGAAVLPYAGLALKRDRGWLAAAKCYSREVKNSFEANANENRYGFYQGAGSLTLLSEDGLQASGLPRILGEGFDWFRFPGTTSAKRNVTADRWPSQFPRGKFASSLNSFCGGVQTALTSITAWGFAFEDLRAKKDEPQLWARKSVFFLDGYILALGSNISGLGDSEEVETTLFQTSLGGTSHLLSADVALSLGDAWQSNPNSTKATLWLRDGVGNGYVLPSVSGSGVRARFAEQESYDHSGKTLTKGNWLTAVLPHKGLHSHYEYVVLMNVSDEELQGFQPHDKYRVLVQDQAVHAVILSGGAVAAVFYEAVSSPAVLANSSLVESVSDPCALVVERNGSGMFLTLSNPKFGWLKDGDTLNAGVRVAHELETRPAKAQETKLQIAGLWRVLSFSVVSGMGMSALATNGIEPAVLAVRSCASTELHFTSAYGQSVETLLEEVAGTPGCTTTTTTTTTVCQPTMQPFLIQGKEDSHLRCAGHALWVPKVNGSRGGKWGGLGDDVDEERCRELCLDQESCKYALCKVDSAGKCSQCSAFSVCEAPRRQNCCNFKIFKKGGCSTMGMNSSEMKAWGVEVG